MSGKHQIYKTIVVISVVFCIGGFIFNTYGTFDKFISQARLVVTSSQSSDFLPLPVFAICNETAYKKLPFGNDTMWREESYLKLTRNVDEILFGIRGSSTDGSMFKVNYTSAELRTIFQGRCLVIHVHILVSNLSIQSNRFNSCQSLRKLTLIMAR